MVDKEDSGQGQWWTRTMVDDSRGTVKGDSEGGDRERGQGKGTGKGDRERGQGKGTGKGDRERGQGKGTGERETRDQMRLETRRPEDKRQETRDKR